MFDHELPWRHPTNNRRGDADKIEESDKGGGTGYGHRRTELGDEDDLIEEVSTEGWVDQDTFHMFRNKTKIAIGLDSDTLILSGTQQVDMKLDVEMRTISQSTISPSPSNSL